MSRPLRIESPGAVYHVTARGNARQPIFVTTADRELFLTNLGKVVSRFGWVCHGYCLLDNHYHLVIETPRANLSAGMRELNGVYAQGFNRRHGRIGHVLQGRFHAVVVERESHLLEVCRYVILNPARAGLCRNAGEWPWSSYRATLGLARRPGFLTVDAVLGYFGLDRDRALQRFLDFVGDPNALPPWANLKGGIFLGSDAFVRGLTDGRNVDPEVPRGQWQPLRPTLAELFARPSPEAIEMAHREHGYRLREIGAHLGVHSSTVSRRLAALRRKAGHESDCAGANARLQDLTPG